MEKKKLQFENVNSEEVIFDSDVYSKIMVFNHFQYPYLINDINVIKFLGQGSLGRVQLGIDTKTKEKYAIKVYNTFVLKKKR